MGKSYPRINIRDFRVGDEDEIWPIIGSNLTRAEYGVWNPPDRNYQCVVAELSESYRTDHLYEGEEHVEYFLAKGSVLGFASLFLLNKIFRPRPVGLIEDVVVERHMQGLGIGRLLVKNLIMRAQQLNCYKIVLNCNTHNQEFYEKLGFYKHEHQMRKDL